MHKIVVSILLSVVMSMTIAGNLTAQSKEHLIVLSKLEHQIYQVDLSDFEDINALLPEGGEILYAPVGLAYHPAEQRLFWIDPVKRVLPSLSLQQVGQVGGLTRDTSLLPLDIAWDTKHSKLYWIDHAQRKVVKANQDRSQRETIALAPSARLHGLAVNGDLNRLFWTDVDRQAIYSGTLKGQDVKQLADSPFPVRIALHAQQRWVYWTDDHARTICRVTFAGNKHECLYTGGADNRPFAIYVDEQADKVYWSDYRSREVSRMDLDGSNQEVVMSDVEEVVGLVVIRSSIEAFQQPAMTIGTALEGNSESLLLYPNPGTGRLTIALADSPADQGTLTVLNAGGQIVFTSSLRSDRHEIDLTHLPAGSYLCKVTNGDRHYQKSFLIIK